MSCLGLGRAIHRLGYLAAGVYLSACVSYYPPPPTPKKLFLFPPEHFVLAHFFLREFLSLSHIFYLFIYFYFLFFPLLLFPLQFSFFLNYVFILTDGKGRIFQFIHRCSTAHFSIIPLFSSCSSGAQKPSSEHVYILCLICFSLTVLAYLPNSHLHTRQKKLSYSAFCFCVH